MSCNHNTTTRLELKEFNQDLYGIERACPKCIELGFIAAMNLIAENIKEIEVLEKEHWEKLDKYGYTNFPETSTETCWEYNYKGLRLRSNHEQNDLIGIKRFVRWFNDTSIKKENE